MIVWMRIEVSDLERRAINHRYGKPGLATRKEVIQEYEMNMRAMLDDLISECKAEGG